MFQRNEDQKFARKLGLTSQEVARIQEEMKRNFGEDAPRRGQRCHLSELSHRVAEEDTYVCWQPRRLKMGE